MFILINPADETIEPVAELSQEAMLGFLGDGDVSQWPLGRMLAITGINALAKPELAFTVLRVGDGLQPLRGPIVLMAQRGFFLDGDIIAHLVEDLRQTAGFYRLVKDGGNEKPVLVSRDGTQTMNHPLLDDCALPEAPIISDN